LISKEEDERFFVTAKAIKKKKSRSDEESFLLFFFFFFFFFFSRGEKARAHQSLDERGCFFARFFPLRVDHRSLEDDPPRAERETERKSIPLDDDGFLPLVSLLFRSKRSEILFILISRYFSKEKRQIFHKLKYFVPGV
jgi:hypothetical protein